MSGSRVASMEMQVTGIAGDRSLSGGIPMYALNDNAPSSRSVLMRFLVRSWEYRRPRLWVGVRVACGIFNVVLGVLLLASVHRLGSLAWLAALPLAGAGLIFWTVYRLQQDSVLRVRELEQSRAYAVDDSAARLRQIERDLHDGAQAQMVAVTMKLGLAMKKLGRMVDGTGKTDLDRVLDLVAAAYQPAGKIIGLSKIARIVARRAAALQVQETLTHQVAAALAEATGSPAVGVWVTGEHLCMLMRGTRAAGARASTQTLLGRAATDVDVERRLHRAAHPGAGGS